MLLISYHRRLRYFLILLLVFISSIEESLVLLLTILSCFPDFSIRIVHKKMPALSGLFDYYSNFILDLLLANLTEIGVTFSAGIKYIEEILET